MRETRPSGLMQGRGTRPHTSRPLPTLPRSQSQTAPSGRGSLNVGQRNECRFARFLSFRSDHRHDRFRVVPLAGVFGGLASFSHRRREDPERRKYRFHVSVTNSAGTRVDRDWEAPGEVGKDRIGCSRGYRRDHCRAESNSRVMKKKKPNQSSATSGTGAVLLTRPLRSTRRRSAKSRLHARPLAAHL